MVLDPINDLEKNYWNCENKKFGLQTTKRVRILSKTKPVC